MRPFIRLLALAILLVLPPSLASAALLSEGDRAAYRLAFAAARNGDWVGAYDAANRAQDKVLVKVVRYLDLSRPNSGARFQEIAGFITENPGWPGLQLLHQRAEEALATAGSDELARWFAQYPPVTPFGRLRDADYWLAQGDTARAVAEIRQVWVTTEFSPFDEKAVLQKYGSYLRHADDIERLDGFLWDGRYDAARRMLSMVDTGHRKAAEARIALAQLAGNAERILRQVPRERLNDPGLLFERMRWRRRSDQWDGAAEILEHAPKDLVRPQAWWNERELIARYALANGQAALAYKLVNDHHMTSGAGYADAEFLAGWIALRFLKEPAKAAAHFGRLYAQVARPVSIARGAYWAGRSAEAQGDRAGAAKWYAIAAQHITTYYGQLSAAQIGAGGKAAVLEDPQPTAQDRAKFDNQELVRIARALGESEAADFSKRFIMRLSDDATTPAEHALIAALALEIGRPDLAVTVARRASYAGVTLLSEGYPLAEVPGGGSVEQPLVLAMTRQESGFDQFAVSRAGARGMMQLMPGTAKTMARQLELPFSQERLLSDVPYNITLGRAYLEGMLDKYGGSYLLAVAAYNAGPARVNQWLRDIGDPRSSSTDVVDWVESIPFSETRNYVQRVLENLQVYRLRLGDRALAFQLPTDLKR
ncbi:MAG TPA: lytic transglycosylase domain-containing protein [Stellaceae bacterium]|nr:lytic transglycosylase domain-containing protein [Stellaceae bacterium]